MKKEHKNIIRIIFALALILISVLPNGTSYIPIFFISLGVLGAYFSAQKDLKEGKTSGKIKIILAGGLVILLIIFIIIKFKKG